MERHESHSTPGQATTTMTDHEPSLESHQQVKRFPSPKPHVPARMAVILGMDAVMLNKVGELYQKYFLKQNTSLPSCVPKFWAWTLSLVLRALFGQFDVENGTKEALRPILSLLLSCSFKVWLVLSEFIILNGVLETYECIADWIMTDRWMLEALVIHGFTDIFDGFLAPYGTTFKKRPKRVVQK